MVIQDRFHVVQHFSLSFNNMDDRFFDVIKLGWRMATVDYDQGVLATIRELALEGRLKKKVTFRKKVYNMSLGTKLNTSTFNQWLDLGNVDVSRHSRWPALSTLPLV